MAENKTEKKGTSLKVRGAVFEGKVVSAKADKTVTVERKLVTFVKKFERYKKKRSRIRAHNPPEINAKEGDTVRIGETRKISKSKAFTVMEIISRSDEK